MEKDIRKINFGKSDAHTEGEDYPELLSKGYVDLYNVVYKAMHDCTFLFLGYKGSGKSSLSEHLRLTEDESVIVDAQRLTNFSFSAFNKIIKSDEEKEIKAQETWRWILCVRVLQNLINDSDARAEDQGNLKKVVDILTQSGIFPLLDVSSLVAHSSTTIFKATLKNFGVEHELKSESIAMTISMATHFIKGLIASYKESHSHLIIIDDLDDILHPNGVQYNVISALINEVQDLNRYFKRNNIPVKILVLCRTDIFDRLINPNKNKIKQDSSYSFIWYNEGVDTPQSNPLVSLINMRTQLVYQDVNDTFEAFFPKTYDRKPIYNALLDFTRHTPRDFVELMNFIQKQCQGCTVTQKNIKDGIKEYSLEYFIQEIRDEMAGYISNDDSDLIIKCLSTLRKRIFSYDDIKRIYMAKANKASEEQLLDILKILYDCSAIGHMYSYDGGNTERITFKCRNRNSTFNSEDKICLHKGLWKALNVNY